MKEYEMTMLHDVPKENGKPVVTHKTTLQPAAIRKNLLHSLIATVLDKHVFSAVIQDLSALNREAGDQPPADNLADGDHILRYSQQLLLFGCIRQYSIWTTKAADMARALIHWKMVFLLFDMNNRYNYKQVQIIPML